MGAIGCFSSIVLCPLLAEAMIFRNQEHYFPVVGLSLGFCKKWSRTAEFKATGKVFTIFFQQ